MAPLLSLARLPLLLPQQQQSHRRSVGPYQSTRWKPTWQSEDRSNVVSHCLLQQRFLQTCMRLPIKSKR